MTGTSGFGVAFIGEPRGSSPDKATVLVVSITIFTSGLDCKNNNIIDYVILLYIAV